jgi:hypothetical protein
MKARAMVTCFIANSNIGVAALLQQLEARHLGAFVEHLEIALHDVTADLERMRLAGAACISPSVTTQAISPSVTTQAISPSATTPAISPLRQRMIEDMSIRKFTAKTQHDYVQRVKDFATFRDSLDGEGEDNLCAAGARRIACDMGWKPEGRRRRTLLWRLRSRQPGRRRRVAGTSSAGASRNLRNETGDVEPALPVPATNGHPGGVSNEQGPVQQGRCGP